MDMVEVPAQKAASQHKFGRGEYEQVLLLWTRVHSSLYGLLSLNITREVCDYLRARISLISFSGNTVREYTSLQTCSEPREISDSFTGAIFSRINALEVLCIGRFPTSNAVSSFNIATLAAREEESMRTKRNCPGVLKVDGFVYVFGGYAGGPISQSGEKFNVQSRHWAPLPDMDQPRAYFNPLQYGRGIILTGASEGTRRISMFNIDSETYELYYLYTQTLWRKFRCR